MKTRSLFLLLLASFLSATQPLAAQTARFFRIAGPVASEITALDREGYLTWTNLATNATFTIQTAPTAQGGTNWVDYVQVPVAGAAATNRVDDPNPPAGMALIPAGSFTMGDNLDGDSSSLPLHTVYVSAFYMDKTEVTKSKWDEVYNWAITHGYSFDYGAMGKAASHPAQSMTWYDAVKWCNARSEKEGLVPAYYTDAAQTTVCRTGEVDVDDTWVNWNEGYRLPTEAEWEKAARGGAIGQRFPWGNTITHNRANYYSYWSDGVPYDPYDVNPTSGYHPTFTTGDYPFTSPVGYFAPNGYGLYDMAGNVFEWCWDWYGTYSSASQSDPRGPASASYRVNRGGGCGGHAGRCRAADRYYDYPTDWNYGVGFRCARAAGQ